MKNNIALIFSLCCFAYSATAEESPKYAKQTNSSENNTLPGKKSNFRGFDRYDQINTSAGHFSVICPKVAAPGKPWLWRSLFWDGVKAINTADLKLVDQGYHIVLAFGDVSGHPRGNANIDAAYDMVTTKYGFSKKCSMASISRGTLSLFRWASSNPEKVESIYVDNGVCNILSWPAGSKVIGNPSTGSGNPGSWKLFKKSFGYTTDAEALLSKESPIDLLEPIAKAKIPILMVCGDKDKAVPYEENDAILEARYKKLGGPIEVIIEEKGHTHGMKDPTPILDFIKNNTTLAASSRTKPNVILVMTDDQGYGDLGCHGNPILKTPELDKMHADSVRFTDFHVSPFCTPTRAALLTGNHPGYTGAYRTSAGRCMMHPDEKTIAHLFADAGYATGMAGKWHLGDNAPHRPQDRGFQDVVWHRCGGIGQASDYWGNDYFDDTYERVKPGSRKGTFEEFKGYCTDVFFSEGMRFVETNKDTPFFLYLALNAPHGPYRVPPEWAAPYQGNKNIANPNFYGMITNIDHNMGLLRAHLEKLKLAENTILIFMTDNGTASGAKFKGLDSEALLGFNAGMRGKKSSVYDGGHRVPFFIHWPKGNLTGGRDIETIGAHIDILPTLADLCDVPLSEDYESDGLSLKPLLNNSKAPWPREHHVIQYHGGPYGKAMPAGPLAFSSVLTERWRLVNSNGQALFDIEKDPAQRNNLAAQHPEVIAELRSHYDQFWNKVSPRLTPVRIDIGDPGEPKTQLCSQDWHMETGNPPWNFKAINKLPKVTAPWLVNIKREGRYRFTLRQWPAEANKPLVAIKAKVTIAGREQEVTVPADSQNVTIDLHLPAGPAKLLTYLYNKQGQSGGAYFTDVEWLEE